MNFTVIFISYNYVNPAWAPTTSIPSFNLMKYKRLYITYMIPRQKQLENVNIIQYTRTV